MIGCGLIHLAQDRDRWRSLVNSVVDLLVPENARNFLPSESFCCVAQC